MPRHNLYKVAPLVESLCKKHDIPYCVKPIGVAFHDIVKYVVSFLLEIEHCVVYRT